MIYIGTDEGIYRWYPGTPWPIFHAKIRPAVRIGASLLQISMRCFKRA